MSSNQSIHNLTFLYRNHDLTDEEQWEREVERGDTLLELERNDVETDLPNNGDQL